MAWHSPWSTSFSLVVLIKIETRLVDQLFRWAEKYTCRFLAAAGPQTPGVWGQPPGNDVGEKMAMKLLWMNAEYCYMYCFAEDERYYELKEGDEHESMAELRTRWKSEISFDQIQVSITCKEWRVEDESWSKFRFPAKVRPIHSPLSCDIAACNSFDHWQASLWSWAYQRVTDWFDFIPEIWHDLGMNLLRNAS